jgi:hypothetical protein
MGKATRNRRKTSDVAVQGGPPATTGSTPGWLWLAASAVLAILVSSWWRIVAPAPRSYDEYYHLALSRMIAADGFPDAFPATPWSIFGARFVDKEPLFHLLGMPFAGGAIEAAGLSVDLLCLVAFFTVAALYLRRASASHAALLVTSFLALGSLFAFRLAMARPHQLLLILSTALLLVLTTTRDPERPRVLVALAAISAAAGLGHTAGWIGIGLAGFWGTCGALTDRAGGDRGLRWKPAAAIAVGWLAGQLVHPNFPGNFRLHWLQGFVIPFQAAGRGNADLEAVIGQELTPLATSELLRQAMAFVPLGLAIVTLIRHPKARTRSALTVTAASAAFLSVSAWRFQRLFELGAPLGVFALALTLGAAEIRWSRRQKLVGAALVVLGTLISQRGLIRTTQITSPPRAMADWVAAHAAPGDRVFTAQWADSAPLLHAAPRVVSMVTLDPTFFWLHDAEAFALFVRTGFGRTSEPARAIRERFGARWVTIPKLPTYETLARQLAASGPTEALQVYDDPFYQVWDVRPGT